MSRKSKLAIAAVAAAVVAPAAIVLAEGAGSDGSPGQSRVPGIESASVHPVAGGPSALGGIDASGGSGGSGSKHSPKLQFFLTPKQTVPAGRTGLKVGPLPKGCRPINGYYFIPHNLRTKVTSEGDSPYGKRQWAFYRNNRTGQPVKKVVYGVVCLRNVKVVH